MMVLTADGSVANPRPGIAAAAAVRASLATLTGAAVLKTKACKSAVLAICGQPKSRISSTSS